MWRERERGSFNIERGKGIHGKHPIRRRRKVEDGRKEIRKEERIREAERSRGKRDGIFLS
jgi:hypothetical protein